jgi:hypothetical protein
MLTLVCLLSTAPSPNIALLSYHDGDDVHDREHEGRYDRRTSLAVGDMNRLCEETHRAYARLYGYTYVNPTQARRWSKLLLNGKRFKLVLLSKALRKHDYVLWVDADVAFHTMQPIQEWIVKMGRKDVLIAADIGGNFLFNTGLILLRATNRTRSFVTDVIGEMVKMPLKGLQDQKAMQTVAARGAYRDMMFIVRPRATFQAFAKLKEAHESSWTVHFTCCNMKCGGKRIPKEYCDPTAYDFRKIASLDYVLHR